MSCLRVIGRNVDVIIIILLVTAASAAGGVIHRWRAVVVGESVSKFLSLDPDLDIPRATV